MSINHGRDILDHIFSRALSGRTLFRDRLLLRSDYVPDRLPFREKQIAAVGEALAPVLRGVKCSNLLLYGKTGTGKTAVSRYVLKRLEERAASGNTKVRFAYSNTRIAGTEYRVLTELAAGVDLTIPFTGLALGEVFDRIVQVIDDADVHVVFVLDELDFLVKNFGDDVLYELTRANEKLPHGLLSIIGISNDLKFKEFLDPRVLSSLGEEEIVFPPYTAEELKVILKDRARRAFNDGAVSEAAINLCAALAGSEHGDARRAVDLLRVSGEVAEREGASIVEEKHIRIAVQRIEQDRIVEALRSLPLHEKMVLVAVLSSGSAESTGQVYNRYTALCRDIRLEPLTQRRVSGLLSELDMLGLLSTNVVSHGRYGRTKRISPLISSQLVREVFKEDPSISFMNV